MIDPFTERLRARSTADERARAQAEVEFFHSQARASSPWRDVLVFTAITAVAVGGFYLTTLKPYIEGQVKS